MEALILLVIMVLVSYYIGGAMLIYTSRKSAARPAFPRADLKTLDDGMADFLIGNEDHLVVEGFQPGGFYFLPSDRPERLPIFSLLTNPETGDKATVTVLIDRPNGTWRSLTHFVEFETRYPDGTVIRTSSCRKLNPVQGNPQQRVFRFPNVAKAGELYHLHGQVLMQSAPNLPKVTGIPGDEISDLIRAMLADSQHLVKRGWIVLDEQHNVYRPTLKGAMMTAWSQQFPMNLIRTVRMRRHVKALRSLPAAQPKPL